MMAVMGSRNGKEATHNLEIQSASVMKHATTVVQLINARPKLFDRLDL
jgi:hypothetical protein